MLKKHNITREPEITETHNGLYGIMHSDGNIYTAFALPVKDFDLGTLGCVSDGYLVICGYNKRAYLLNRKGYLSIDYIMEKFYLNEFFAESFIYLLSKMLPERRIKDIYC